MPDFPWYEAVDDGDIEQGDFLFDLVVPVVLDRKTEIPPVKMDAYDGIIMTQSCDIPKVDQIVLCPVWNVSDAEKLNPEFGNQSGLENLRKGRYVAYHLLNECAVSEFPREYMIVQFDNLLVLPKTEIEQEVSSRQPRLRLLPPYREHLAQAFARFFMRVGLPIDISPFK